MPSMSADIVGGAGRGSKFWLFAKECREGIAYEGATYDSLARDFASSPTVPIFVRSQLH